MNDAFRRGRLHLRLVLVVGLFVPSVAGAGEALAEEPGRTSGSVQTVSARPGVEGVAAYYAKRYEGKRTTSGERYCAEKLTAAHPEAPLGSLFRIVDLASGKEVVVRVNDRCRKKRVPFIDLSRAAARELGFLGKGKARVRITLLDEDSREAVVAESEAVRP